MTVLDTRTHGMNVAGAAFDEMAHAHPRPRAQR
jgi:hypothetical protein